MDGKGKKSGSKRGSKIVRFEDDADDDEPIKSLFNVMKHKSSKKKKVETESTTGKEGQRKAVEKQLNAVDKDSEDMGDTLASFRKRLKGSKKGVRSEVGMDGTVKEKTLDNTHKPGLKSRTRSTIGSAEVGAELFCSKPLAALSVGNTNEVPSVSLRGCLNKNSVEKMVDSTLECYTHKTILDSCIKNKRVDCISETGTLLYKSYGKDEAASPGHEIPVTVSGEKEVDVFHRFPNDESKRPPSEKAMELSRVSNVHAEAYSPIARKEVGLIASDRHMHLGEPDSESGYFREKNLVMCDCGIHVNIKDGSFESNAQVAICQKCKHTSHNDASDGGGIQVHALFKDGTAEASPISISPCEDESFRGDAITLPNSGKPSTLQRPERIARKRKLGNMVHEGDTNWENEQGFLDCQSDKSFKGSDRCDSFPFNSKDTEIGRAAAVTAGLKAHSVSPIEKIILKEVLKRKGSHQEYLVCRLVCFSIAVMHSNTWFSCSYVG